MARLFSIRKYPVMTIKSVEQFTDSHIHDLHALYQAAWWTKGRKLSDVRRMLQHSNVIVAFGDDETGRLIAFARVLTDYVYKALIFDVIVEDSYQKTGLGRALMNAIVNHPSLKDVRHLELYCLPEMIPFYQKWGFTVELGELCFMRRAK